jgi:hypothetical protein
MRRCLIITFVLAELGFAILAVPPRAQMVATHSAFIVDKAAHRDDKVPPPTPELEFKSVWRETGATPISENRWRGPVSDQFGDIMLHVSPPADSLEHVGYLIHFVDGRLPEGLVLPTEPWSIRHDDLILVWNDQELWYQEPFSFRMFVSAIDGAGNESAPSNVVTVADDGAQGQRFEDFKRQSWGNQHCRNYMLKGTFEGEWHGKDERGNSVRIIFDKGHLALTVGDSTRVGFVCASKRDEDHPLDCIDIEFADQERGMGWRFGIFELHQDRLVICMPSEIGTRPATFLAGKTAHRYDLIRMATPSR